MTEEGGGSLPYPSLVLEGEGLEFSAAEVIGLGEVGFVVPEGSEGKDHEEDGEETSGDTLGGWGPPSANLQLVEHAGGGREGSRGGGERGGARCCQVLVSRIELRLLDSLCDAS